MSSLALLLSEVIALMRSNQKPNDDMCNNNLMKKVLIYEPQKWNNEYTIARIFVVVVVVVVIVVAALFLYEVCIVHVWMYWPWSLYHRLHKLQSGFLFDPKMRIWE